MFKRRAVMLVAVVTLMAVMGAAVPSFATYYTTGEADGYMLWTGDYDWYGVDLSSGVQYCVSVSVPWNADFEVKVYYDSNHDRYASDWECVGSGTRGTGEDEYVYFTAHHSGRYHIKVYSYRGHGDYTIRLRRNY